MPLNCKIAKNPTDSNTRVISANLRRMAVSMACECKLLRVDSILILLFLRRFSTGPLRPTMPADLSDPSVFKDLTFVIN